MTRKKKIFYWGYLFCAFVFLFNPNANLIDVLPDAVAYLMLILAICKRAFPAL